MKEYFDFYFDKISNFNLNSLSKILIKISFNQSLYLLTGLLSSPPSQREVTFVLSQEQTPGEPPSQRPLDSQVIFFQRMDQESLKTLFSYQENKTFLSLCYQKSYFLLSLKKQEYEFILSEVQIGVEL